MPEELSFTDQKPTSDRTSIFDRGYIPTSKDARYADDYRQKTYLQISSAAYNELSNQGLSTSDIQSLRDDDFWELIVTEYSEQHAENMAVHNVLSESFCWFATGPAPVQVSLTANLLTSDAKDHRTHFLYMYTSNMRVKQLSRSARTLTLVMKDTVMKLFILSLSFSENSQMPDFSTVTISGIGYKYQNMYSASPTLYTGYYGKTAAVPTLPVSVKTSTQAAPQTQQSGEVTIAFRPGSSGDKK